MHVSCAPCLNVTCTCVYLLHVCTCVHGVWRVRVCFSVHVRYVWFYLHVAWCMRVCACMVSNLVMLHHMCHQKCLKICACVILCTCSCGLKSSYTCSEISHLKISQFLTFYVTLMCACTFLVPAEQARREEERRKEELRTKLSISGTPEVHVHTCTVVEPLYSLYKDTPRMRRPP